MKINKSISNVERADIAYRLLNKLRAGDMMHGNPAEGLKRSLKKLQLEDKRANSSINKTDWKISSGELKSQIAKLKQGIKGEESLASYLQKIIKYTPELDGLIVFASLSTDISKEDELGYIPDSDFLCIYGNNILVLDSKAIKTPPVVPLYIKDNILKLLSKDLMEVKPSTPIWRNLLQKEGILSEYNVKFGGITVIINNTGCLIWKNEDWYKSDCRPVFIGDLEEYLKEWVENIKESQGEQIISLDLLSIIANTQIRKEKTDLDVSNMLQKFKI